MGSAVPCECSGKRQSFIVTRRRYGMALWRFVIVTLWLVGLICLPGCEQKPPTVDSASLYISPPIVWTVANKPQIIVALYYNRGTNVVLWRDVTTYESGARVFVCDLEGGTSTLLCDIRFPEARYAIHALSADVWIDDAFYLRMDAFGDVAAQKSVICRVQLSGGCEIVQETPLKANPMMAWGNQKVLFLAVTPPPGVQPPFFVMTNPAADGGHAVLVRSRLDSEWEPRFSVASGTMEVVSLRR